MIPQSVKKEIRLLQRKWQDIVLQKKYAKTITLQPIGNVQKEVEIEIKKGAFFENKMHNLTLVESKLNGVIINPNEIFSFWKIVGEASQKSGFKVGRNLINESISSDFGGGICQYSSLIYYSFLNSDFKILERHPHSVDIYKESERFLPLGADSTVSYGFKDLQFYNNLGFPIQLMTSIIDQKILQLQIRSTEEMNFKNLRFKYKEINGGVCVETIIDDFTQNITFYKR